MKRLNRTYRIFIAVLMLFTISSFTIVAAENEHGTLVANHLKIPIYRTYRMYVKTYNKATQAYIAKGERIVLHYTSANEAVIEAKGNAFKSVGNGKTEVTLRISGAYPGTLDAFDPNNVLDEMKFTVEVNDQVDMVFPQFSISWGEDKATVLDRFLKNNAYINYTNSYWAMNPKISADSRKGLEILSTNNAEFPLIMLDFTSNDTELCALYLLSASWERVTTPQISEVYKLLIANGFLDRGTNTDTHCWQMYNPTSKTLATCGLMIVQGCGYCYVSLSYLADDPNPTAIKNTLLEQPKISWNFANGVLNIQAEQYVGEPLSIYSISGKCLQKTTIQPGNNIISSLTHQPFFIRVGNNAAIKVLP